MRYNETFYDWDKAKHNLLNNMQFVVLKPGFESKKLICVSWIWISHGAKLFIIYSIKSWTTGSDNNVFRGSLSVIILQKEQCPVFLRDPCLEHRHHQQTLMKDFIYLFLYGNDNPVWETAKETQMYRTVFWTLWWRGGMFWENGIETCII